MTVTPEIYVDPRRDEVLVRFDFQGPIHSLTREGVSVVASRPLYEDDLVYTPESHDERLEAHEREIEKLEDEHTEAVEKAEEVSEEKGREAGLAEAKDKLLDVLHKVVRLPEVEALFVDGLGARELLHAELLLRLEEAL